jgi:cell volume regulation protein A
MHGGSIELGVLLVGVLLLAGVMASKLSTKLAVPAFLLFIALGMLAGSEGPGGIPFEDFGLVRGLGMFLLVYILFAGGLDTQWSALRPVAKRGLALSTIGVVLTAGIVGVFSHYAIGLPWAHSMLLGAIVSSTDSAAIFSVLRSRGLLLKHKVGPTLEFESGTNDPMAVFLTLGITQAIINPASSPWLLLPNLVKQMALGLAVGYVFGLGTVRFINRIRLEYDGLYPVITVAAVAIVYGVAHIAGGSEYLAVYVMGLVMGSKNFLHKIGLMQFHDGFAWLLQISVFLAFGLLAFPSQLVPVMVPGILLALFMMLVARPLAVYLSLLFAHVGNRTKLFLAWAGLRGAFPIVLGTVPVLEGVSQGHMLFNLVFFVVVASVLIQGTSLRWVAHKLHILAEQRKDEMQPASRDEMLELTLQADSPAADKQVVELGLPATALLLLLTREGKSYIPRGGTILRPGDVILVATRRQDQDELRSRLLG